MAEYEESMDSVIGVLNCSANKSQINNLVEEYR
jgi:hypothetical protein